MQGEDAEEAGAEEKGEGKKRRKKKSKKAVEEDEEGGGKEEEPSLIDIASGDGEEAPPTAALATKTESPRKKSPARDTKKQGISKYGSLIPLYVYM